MLDCRQFTVELPMRMSVNKHGELESLNLNVYRNLHFYQLNYQKKEFQRTVKPFLFGLPPMEAVFLHYEINPKGGSRLDTMNVGSIVDKFFSDALVENGIIPDDDYKHVVGNSFSFGSLCPKNPHVLVTITEIKSKKVKPMRILLDQQEIQAALETFVGTMGFSGAAGVQLSLNGNEIQAEIIMNGPVTSAIEPHLTNMMAIYDSGTVKIQPEQSAEQPAKRRGRLPGSKNKPKGDNANVATATETGNDLYGSGDFEAGEDEDSSDEINDSGEQSENEGVDIFGKSFDDGSEETDGTESEQSSVGSKSNRGNLFGDSGDVSSETTNPDEEDRDNPPKDEKVSRKRSSIFDVD